MKRLIILFTTLFIVTSRIFCAEGGYSNYIPGTYGDFGLAVKPSEGITVRNDLYYYNASSNKTIRNTGTNVDGDITIKMNLFTMLYTTNKKFFGGTYAFGTLIPIVDLGIDGRVNTRSFGNHSFSDDASGLGDITFIPGMLFWRKGNMHFSLAEFIIAPTADYDKDATANTGLNYYSFDTNFAATYLNEKTGQDYSVNIGHIYNTENKDTNYQTGQEIHIDLVLNQFLSETFAIGIHSFYLKQFTDDQIGSSLADSRLGDFKGKSAGTGPAVMWSTKLLNQDVAFIAKWMHEFSADSRIKGDHILLSFATSF